MPRHKMIDGVKVQFTAEEETARDAEEKAWADASNTRKLYEIKKIRLQKLKETDYMANSDYTMPSNTKTWRQSLRDIPSNYDSSKYDELLARNADKSSLDYKKLTHSIWTKPS